MRSFAVNCGDIDSDLHQFVPIMLTEIFRTLRQIPGKLRGSALYFLQIPLWAGIIINIASARLRFVAGEILTAVCLTAAARLTRNYFRSLPQQPENCAPDKRKEAAGLTALGCFVLTETLFSRPPLFALITAALGATGYALCYMTVERRTIPTHPNDIPKELPRALKDMLSHAYSAIENIETIAVYLGNTEHERIIARRLEKVARCARSLIYHIRYSPERIRSARSFLVVHLPELNHICQQYVRDIPHAGHTRQRKVFQQLLLESYQSFSKLQQQLTQQHQQNLDIRMQVLREQLTRSDTHE